MTAQLHWLIRKDLVGEFRARRLWAETIHLGILTAFLFGLQVELPGEYQRRVGATLFWFAVLFAGMPTMERCFAPDREEGFLDGLFLVPIRPSTIYFAKLVVNAVVLSGLACVLVPLWIGLLDVPMLERPVAFLPVVALAIVGIASVGTLLSALLGSARQRTGGLMLLVLPLVLPVVIAASEATRLAIEGDRGDEWQRWVMFLATFALVFVVAGWAFFEIAVKE